MRAPPVATEAVNVASIEDVPVCACPMPPEFVSELPGNCPVCNMALIDQRIAVHEHYHHTGATRVGPLNEGQFDSVPDVYEGTIYTCPMHAEVRHRIDKTGTMTECKPRMVAILPEARHDEVEVLRLAASLERGSEHPLAEAIVRGAEERGVELVKTEDFEVVTGKGVKDRVNGQAVALGNAALIHDMGLDSGTLVDTAKARRDEGETVMFIVLDGTIAGLFSVADTVKETTPAALKALHELGFRIIMATGDNEHTARAVARRLGIDEKRADVLPQDKARIVSELQDQSNRVAMAGDCVNDAPALAQADVGIAMGAGADVAIVSAGITLIKGDLSSIVKACRLSRATMRNIRQNLYFALIYNAAGVPFAASVLYPFFGILIGPIFAAFAMSASSLSVVLNALRLRTVNI